MGWQSRVYLLPEIDKSGGVCMSPDEFISQVVNHSYANARGDMRAFKSAFEMQRSNGSR